MASVADRVSAGNLSPQVRQLACVWMVGSVTMGTVAAIFLALPPARPVSPGQPVAPVFPVQPGAAGSTPVAPLAALPALAEAGVLALVAALFAVLAVLAWRTRGTSWLPEEARGRMLWALLVGGLGIAGWLFAATVAFGAMFGSPVQLVLGYIGGGLPFALAAAVLQRSAAVNVAAIGASAVLVAIGFILVAARSEYEPSALRLYFQYIGYLLGGQTIGYPPGGPIRLG